jgi:hypothetical protein
MVKVVSLDPGITTGWTYGEIERAVLTDPTSISLVFKAGCNRWDHFDMWRWLRVMDPHIIIYESFEFRQKARDNVELFSRELIGVANLYHQATDKCTAIYKQSPSEAMGFFTNRRLKEMNCYPPGPEHPKDATRHLLHWWQFKAGAQYHMNMEGKVKMVS